MKYALSDFEFEIRGSGSNAIFLPFMLKIEDKNKVQKVIQFFEKNLHKKKIDVDLNSLGSIFLTEKIAKSLVVTLNRYFLFSSQTSEDIIGLPKTKEEKEETRTSNISDFLKKSVFSDNDIHQMEASQIRSITYDIVNEITQGFVKFSERDKMISRIEKKLKIPKDSLENLLFFDIESERILVKVEDTKPSSITAWFNYDTIETTLSYALDLQIKSSKLPGHIAKNLVYVSKKNYVFSDISLEEDGYVINILPPLEMFKDKGNWGRNISKVSMFIIRSLLKEKIDFQLKSIIMPRKRKALFTLDSNFLPTLPSFREDEDKQRPEIDSKIEDRFLKSWKSYHGWKAYPEPEAIIIGKKLYVPDFLLERGDKSVYVEIVGFYTMKYIQKKKTQMKELSSLGVPILYLVDKEISVHFNDVRNVIILQYTGTSVPSKELLNILDSYYSDFEERLPNFRKTISNICSELKESNSLRTLQQIQESLGTYSSDETDRVLNNSEIKEIVDSNSIILITSFGLVSASITKEVRSFLKQVKRISLDNLKQKYPRYKEALIAISQYLGCKIHWKSIEEVEIIAPR